MLKLNSLQNNIFDSETIALKLNSIGEKGIKVGETTIIRSDIIATGRLVACEYIGSHLNKRSKNLEEYKSRLNGKTDYATLSKLHTDAKFAFCAGKAYEAIGAPIPDNINEIKQDRSLYNNDIFLATMQSIDKSIIQPLFFDVIDDVSMGGLMNWSEVGIGQTKQIDIKSNDVFMFQDASHGSQWASPYNYMYGKTVTLTPKPRTCNVKIKWYQDIVNGEAGEYYAAIMRGMYSDIYANFVNVLTQASQNTKYMPSSLIATSYTTQNWLQITTNVAAANGLTRSDLVAFGLAVALNNVLPVDSQGAMLGLQYGLGEEWFRSGFLPKAGNVDLLEIRPAIVPHTQNRDIVTIFPDDVIYIAAKGAGSYAPIQGVYAAGSPLTLTLTPDQDADMTINIAVEAMYDFAPIFGSKIGMIEV